MLQKKKLTTAMYTAPAGTIIKNLITKGKEQLKIAPFFLYSFLPTYL